MADKVSIGAEPTAPTAKLRNPVLVVVFSVITLGIYYVYWWYQINREMVDLGRYYNADRLGDNAFLSLLAVFPGSIVIIPAYVSLYNTVKRVQRAQEVTAGQVTLNGMIILWLIIASFFIFITALIVPGYIQGELNKAWIAMQAGQQVQAAQVAAPVAAAVPEAAAAPADQPPAGS
jgi:membrane protease YdiL (CAAX protease family)